MEATVEVRSFHWSVVKEMVMLEADWQASLRFKGRYEELSSEQKRTVRGEMLLLLNEEEAYMLNYLP